jgi:hypothetical protein
LESSNAVDTQVRTTRSQGAAGLAPWPDDSQYLGVADLADDTSVLEKTSSLLAAMRTEGSGVAYHVVIPRTGAVYVVAPLDEEVSPISGAENAVCVAIEGAARKRRTAGSRAEVAPLTGNQIASLGVLLAKLKSVYGVDPVVSGALQYAVRPEDTAIQNLPSPIKAESAGLASLLAAVQAEGAYDVATEVFRTSPPATSARSEARTVIGTEDTMGAMALLLGAYADVAALDRSDQMQQVARRTVFVQRARVAHTEGVEGAEAASTAANSEQLTPTIPTVENPGPHTFDYTTGKWGDEP